MDVHIRPLVPGDWLEVSRIYREGIDTGDATFATEVPTWADWDAARHPTVRIVAEVGGRTVGFATVSEISNRCVYRGVAEVTVYVGADARGRGVGRRLMHALAARSEEAGIWSLHAGIFPENHASIALHEAVGFRVVGTYDRLGRTARGVWRDVVLMERRSNEVGTG